MGGRNSDKAKSMPCDFILIKILLWIDRDATIWKIQGERQGFEQRAFAVIEGSSLIDPVLLQEKT